jgi:hypothetical protein
MKHIFAVALLFVIALGLYPQSKFNLGTQSKSPVDFTGIATVKPVTASASLPGTCVAFQMLWLTTATAGQNLYGCTATNTWTQLSGGGGTTLPWTTLGDTVYFNGTAAARLAGPTTTGNYVLCESPSGSAVAPAWCQQYTIASGLGASVTGSGNLQVNTKFGTRTVSGTTDTLANTDCGGGVWYTSTSAVSVALPQAATGGNFLQGCAITITAYGGTSGAVTVTASSSYIGPASLALNSRVIATSSGSSSSATFHSCTLVSNGTNYDLKDCN